jgi:hypothetical protein
LGEIFQTLVTYGHSLEAIKNEYSVNQVYLFYEKCKKREIEAQRDIAITVFNAALCTSPSYSTKSAHDKQRQWNKFMDSLDWDKIAEKGKKKTIGDMKKLFAGLGINIPIIESNKKDDE